MLTNGKTWDPCFPIDPRKSPIFYGWVIMVMAAVGMIASIPGQTVGVSIYTDILIENLGLSRIQLTTSYLIGTGCSGLLVSAGGTAFDRLGGRQFFVMASILFGVALIAFAQMDILVQATGLAGVTAAAFVISATAFLGIRFFGQGMVTLGARSILNKWWNLRRGLVISINGCLVGFGFSIAPRILDWEVQTLGWRGSLLFNAFCLIVPVAGFGWLLFRDNPEECGLEMDNGWHPKKRRENPDTLLKKEFTRAEALRSYPFWILTLSLAFQGLFATAYTFHVIDIARSFAVPRETMLNFFIYSSLVSIVTNLVSGYVADFIRLRYIISLFGIFGVVFAGGILLLPTMTGQVLLVLGMGSTWGLFPIISSIGYPRYYGRKHLGAITGASLSGMVWGGAFGPLAFSLCRDYAGGYQTAMVVSVVVYITLGIAGLFAVNPSAKSQT